MKTYIDFFIRAAGAIANAINRKNKKDMVNDAAGTIANSSDGVLKSEQSFSDLAGKSRSNRAE